MRIHWKSQTYLSISFDIFSLYFSFVNFFKTAFCLVRLLNTTRVTLLGTFFFVSSRLQHKHFKNIEIQLFTKGVCRERKKGDFSLKRAYLLPAFDTCFSTSASSSPSLTLSTPRKYLWDSNYKLSNLVFIFPLIKYITHKQKDSPRLPRLRLHQ